MDCILDNTAPIAIFQVNQRNGQFMAIGCSGRISDVISFAPQSGFSSGYRENVLQDVVVDSANVSSAKAARSPIENTLLVITFTYLQSNFIAGVEVI